MRALNPAIWPKDTWFDISEVSITSGVNVGFFSGDTKGKELLSYPNPHSLNLKTFSFGLAA